MPKIQVSEASIQLQPPKLVETEYDPFLDEDVENESPLERIEEEAEGAASPLSPHGMLLKVAHSTALQVHVTPLCRSRSNKKYIILSGLDRYLLVHNSKQYLCI